MLFPRHQQNPLHFHILQTGAGKISLVEFRAMVERRPLHLATGQGQEVQQEKEKTEMS